MDVEVFWFLFIMAFLSLARKIRVFLGVLNFKCIFLLFMEMILMWMLLLMIIFLLILWLSMSMFNFLFFYREELNIMFFIILFCLILFKMLRFFVLVILLNMVCLLFKWGKFIKYKKN